MALRIAADALSEAYLGRSLSIEECAKLFGCSTYSIWRLLRKYGIPTRGKDTFTKFSKIPEEALRRAYLEEKKTLRECGELFGTSAAVISKALKFYGIPVRVGGPIKGKDYPRRRKIELSGLEELWEEGYGVRDIAFLLGADEALVRKRLKQLGLWIPKRKPKAFVSWGEKCPRCQILFDSGSFSKTKKGVCEACEREMNTKEILQRRGASPESRDEKELSPLQLLEKWKELLSDLPKDEAGKLKTEWLSSMREKLSQGERRLLGRIQKRLKIKGLGKVSTLELVTQLGILFEEYDYKGSSG